MNKNTINNAVLEKNTAKAIKRMDEAKWLTKTISSPDEIDGVLNSHGRMQFERACAVFNALMPDAVKYEESSVPIKEKPDALETKIKVMAGIAPILKGVNPREIDASEHEVWLALFFVIFPKKIS